MYFGKTAGVKAIFPGIIFLLFSEIAFAQKIVRYDLYVKDTTVNFTGKLKRAIAVNGQIPMPTLTFTEGDTAEIYVHNELNEETSLHWHGLFLPNKYDGVPNLTQMLLNHILHICTGLPLFKTGRTGIIAIPDCRSRSACMVL